jgi:hypothetical protein
LNSNLKNPNVPTQKGPICMNGNFFKEDVQMASGMWKSVQCQRRKNNALT